MVFNQDLSICRKTGTALVLKLNIDFITLWDDPMQDGSLTIINTFQLFKQTALIDQDKTRIMLIVMIAGSEKDAFSVTLLY